MRTATTASLGVSREDCTRRSSTAVNTIGVLAKRSARCRCTKAAAGAPMLTMRSSGFFAWSARRYSTNGASESSSLDRALISEWSVISSGQGDCRSSSVRMVRAYSFHGLKSRPNECSTITRLDSAAKAAWHASSARQADHQSRCRANSLPVSHYPDQTQKQFDTSGHGGKVDFCAPRYALTLHASASRADGDLRQHEDGDRVMPIWLVGCGAVLPRCDKRARYALLVVLNPQVYSDQSANPVRNQQVMTPICLVEGEAGSSETHERLCGCVRADTGASRRSALRHFAEWTRHPLD